MAKREIGRPQTAHIPPFGLRLQPELKEQIEMASKAAGRSMNAEIVDRLQRSFDVSATDAETAFVIANLEVQLAHERMDAASQLRERENMAKAVLVLLEAMTGNASSELPSPLEAIRKRASDVIAEVKKAEPLDQAVARFAEAGNRLLHIQDRLFNIKTSAPGHEFPEDAAEAARKLMKTIGRRTLGEGPVPQVLKPDELK